MYGFLSNVLVVHSGKWDVTKWAVMSALQDLDALNYRTLLHALRERERQREEIIKLISVSERMLEF